MFTQRVGADADKQVVVADAEPKGRFVSAGKFGAQFVEAAGVGLGHQRDLGAFLQALAHALGDHAAHAFQRDNTAGGDFGRNRGGCQRGRRGNWHWCDSRSGSRGGDISLDDATARAGPDQAREIDAHFPGHTLSQR